ncbi:hypothetical protein MA16_Dca024324 [Dendrobium catenatum]|uniref:Uncharacterized protein n=1 Tax=Dendrobium catenatum TaxID=906689 RepID=A0A2I0W1M6_9ASPA|nr:hypothetical protein MA16_Dca024324 [Dendrobium catenatum]
MANAKLLSFSVICALLALGSVVQIAEARLMKEEAINDVEAGRKQLLPPAGVPGFPFPPLPFTLPPFPSFPLPPFLPPFPFPGVPLPPLPPLPIPPILPPNRASLSAPTKE